jgi:pimeloyl-ACP methyl ester carboxylesterase
MLMARHIDGALYSERMGRQGPVMAFVHPNPMDQSCWIFQMAQMSTWFRCIAMDVPGYGRSPKSQPGLTMQDMAQACWEAVDEACPGEPAVLVGCSVGSAIIVHMHHLRPDKTKALILSGTGYYTSKDFIGRRVKSYTEQGVGFRWPYTFDDFSPAFRASPMAHFFANMFVERNASADLQSILYQFEAHAAHDAPDHHARVACPSIILSGSEDGSHRDAFVLKDRIPGCEIKVLPGAGHACNIEQPGLFNRFMIEFLKRNGLFPAA